MMKVRPISALHGEVQLPADKSISHRYAILGAMAQGTTRITNFSTSADCQSTLQCLEQLGVEVRRHHRSIEIESRGWRELRQPKTSLDAGNSGTTIRLLAALLAASAFTSVIQGDASLNRRPMKRIIDPLSRMGARIEASDGEYPPLKVTGSSLNGIAYRLPIPSAQVKSCLLLAGSMASGETTVIEEIPSRNHTELALPFFSVPLERKDGRLQIAGPVCLKPTEMVVPSDFSAATFFILAALMIPDSEISLLRLGLNPTRTKLLFLLEQSGAVFTKSEPAEYNGEPVCNLTVRFSGEVLKRFPSELDQEWIPNLIDEIPALAIFGTRLVQGLRVRGAAELRAKESDRIRAVVSNLRNLGIRAEESTDGFFVPPTEQIGGGRVETFGDHRIAMAFAMAGLIAREPVELDDPSCVSISFPAFFHELQSVSR